MKEISSYSLKGFQIFRNNSKNKKLQDLLKFKLQIEDDLRKKKHITGFEGADGFAKQYIDVFSCYKENILKLINAPEIKRVADGAYEKRNYGVITHCKLSLKTPNKKSQWCYHQDNAYKPNMGETPRVGYAVMIMLEDTNENNGCLHILEGSHVAGLIEHEKIVDNKDIGSYQLAIKDIPKAYIDMPIHGKPGDMVMFDNNTIHYSGDSIVNSNRIALIFEVNHTDKIELDDYGRIPHLLYGNFTTYDLIKLKALSFVSKKRIQMMLQNHKKIKKIIKLILKH
jgi:hypothetical protein